MANLSDDVYEEMESKISIQVTEIRNILKSEHRLVIPEQCDEFIARCIRVKDGNVENAVKIIRAFYVTITNMRSWDVSMKPTSGLDVYKTGVAEPLISIDPSLPRIFVVRAGLWNPEQMSSKEILAFLWMILQFFQSERLEIQRKGVLMVWDFTDFTLQQAMAVHHTALLSTLKWMQSGVMGRISAIHCIHHPRVVGLIYKAMKPFLKEKMKRRLIFHDSIESLLKSVGSKNLPQIIGGSLDLDHGVDRNLVEGFFSSDQYFKDMLEIGFPRK